MASIEKSTKEDNGIFWNKANVPVSRRFDDPYYSLHDGLAEARYVFLQGNGLPQRFRPGFHIAELGFGTGLNALCSWQAWQETQQSGILYFTSFEAFALSPDDMAHAHRPFDDLSDLSAIFCTELARSPTGFTHKNFCLNLILGDARTTVPAWSEAADAWFLDGFSPAKNPQMWERNLMRDVAIHTTRGGTCATFSAAGHVRRNLTEAGFSVRRVPGFGRKRHMSIGTLQ